MKAVKKIFIFAVVLMIFSLSGCAKGKELIRYNNSKRDTVIKEYVGAKVDIKDDPSSKLKSYSYTGETADTYYITVENTDTKYFFDGVVHFNSVLSKSASTCICLRRTACSISAFN